MSSLEQIIQFVGQPSKSLLLFPVRGLSIYIHRCFNVLVTHDGLDHLQVALRLTQPRGKGMS